MCVFSYGLLFVLLLVVVVLIFGLLIIELLFLLFGVSYELIFFIKEYMVVWYFMIFLFVLFMAGNSVICVIGDIKIFVKIMMLVGLINGVFDLLLIFGYGLFFEFGI